MIASSIIVSAALCGAEYPTSTPIQDEAAEIVTKIKQQNTEADRLVKRAEYLRRRKYSLALRTEAARRKRLALRGTAQINYTRAANAIAARGYGGAKKFKSLHDLAVASFYDVPVYVQQRCAMRRIYHPLVRTYNPPASGRPPVTVSPMPIIQNANSR